jgi:hypothetical protein
MTRYLVLAGLFAACAPTLGASASIFDVVANAYSDGADLDGGQFSLDGTLALSVLGDAAYADFNLDGFSDEAIPVEYDATYFLDTDYFLLTIDPGNVTAHSSYGPLSTLFDWALTAYEEPVDWGEPLAPVGSVLFGSAVFEADRTILDANEGLMWFDGLTVPDWAGYALADFSAIEFTKNDDGSFNMKAIPAPAAWWMFLSAAISSRRRRRGSANG